MQKVSFGRLGFDVSRLGFGTMRLPTRTQDGKKCIDRDEAIKMIRFGIDQGITYVDTAYGYHNEESEIVTGLALKDGYREKVTLTTKLPYWVVSEKGDLDKTLDKQLKKLDVPYVDFYILHAMNKADYEKLCALDYKGFYDRALKDGRIRHTGFSFHDDAKTFLNILNDYDFDMAQVQFNYLDEHAQATIDGVRAAGKRGTAVVVMEPLRGGALAQPPREVRGLIEQNEHGWSPAEWALRYVAAQPEVATILSGMSTMEQLKDNLRIFSQNDVRPGALTAQDLAFTARLREEYLKRVPIGCTHCDYCQPCPRDVAIPDLFHAYNESKMLDRPAAFASAYRGFLNDEHDASRCVACGKCEKICPQHLKIISLLKTLRAEYEARG
jgi:predicted aldo/keto reductase-like oxidoreductase